MSYYRFPRTLDEAFGPDASSVCAITCYRAPRAPRVLMWSIFAAAALAVLLRTLGA